MGEGGGAAAAAAVAVAPLARRQQRAGAAKAAGACLQHKTDRPLDALGQGAAIEQHPAFLARLLWCAAAQDGQEGGLRGRRGAGRALK